MCKGPEAGAHLASIFFFFGSFTRGVSCIIFFHIPSNLSGQSRNLHNSPFLAEEIESQRG